MRKKENNTTIEELASQIQENMDNIRGARDVCECLNDQSNLYYAVVTITVRPEDEDLEVSTHIEYPKCTLETMSGEDAEVISGMLQANIIWRTEEHARLLKQFSEVTSDV